MLTVLITYCHTTEIELETLLVEHGHNMDYEHPEIPRVKSWKEIYEIIVGR